MPRNDHDPLAPAVLAQICIGSRGGGHVLVTPNMGW